MADKMTQLERERWFDKVLGYQPSYDDLKYLSVNEPGLFQLLTEIMDYDRARRRWKKERAAEREQNNDNI